MFIGSSEEAKYLPNYKPPSTISSFPADLTVPKWPPRFGRTLQPFDGYFLFKYVCSYEFLGKVQNIPGTKTLN